MRGSTPPSCRVEQPSGGLDVARAAARRRSPTTAVWAMVHRRTRSRSRLELGAQPVEPMDHGARGCGRARGRARSRRPRTRARPRAASGRSTATARAWRAGRCPACRSWFTSTWSPWVGASYVERLGRRRRSARSSTERPVRSQCSSISTMRSAASSASGRNGSPAGIQSRGSRPITTSSAARGS